MAVELSSAGITLKYCAEATAGTRPTTGYTTVAGVKSLPSYNPEPALLDVTDLSNTAWKRYIPGLRDPGGALAITVNESEDFHTAWETLMTTYSGLTGGKKMWFEIAIPGLTDSFYFKGVPTALGFNGAEVDTVLENVVYITPNSEPSWETAST